MFSETSDAKDRWDPCRQADGDPVYFVRPTRRDRARARVEEFPSWGLLAKEDQTI